MKVVKKKFLMDVCHGWLSVKIKEIYELGLEDKISVYSYKKGQTAYLEEDCDAPLYLKAQRDRGVDVQVSYGKCQERSPIRNYCRWTDNWVM